MIKNYHTTQRWNDWLAQFLGQQVLLAEQDFLLKTLAKYFGKHALLIGALQQHLLLETTAMPYQTLLTTLGHRKLSLPTIQSGLKELPIGSGSVDLVLVPHTLEQLDHAQHLLSEACRIVKPQGHIVILGFNPFSIWGAQKWFAKLNPPHWCQHFIPPSTIIKWLKLADFELIKQDKLIFRPPITHPALYHKLKFLEWFGQKCYKPLGAVYILIAKAKVIPLTPIKLSWRQQLSGIQATTIPGPTTMRGS